MFFHHNVNWFCFFKKKKKQTLNSPKQATRRTRLISCKAETDYLCKQTKLGFMAFPSKLIHIYFPFLLSHLCAIFHHPCQRPDLISTRNKIPKTQTTFYTLQDLLESICCFFLLPNMAVFSKLSKVCNGCILTDFCRRAPNSGDTVHLN